ncbi:MAG: cupin domain-containing protein [Betaproteobacteria bacterium]|nr:cupin domain-containing protein [Betaproteobacteria bacterium]
MPFYRFENLEQKSLTPDLSSARGPVIEGEYMYFCLVHKVAGTGSEPHYHPNELLIFPTRGEINAIVGKDRRVVTPGTFVHAPAYARHSMKATESGDLSYLYIKDKTWTVVGLAADQAVPDKAFTVDEINKLIDSGAQRQVVQGQSQAIVEGLNECYYPLVESLDAPQVSARRVYWIEGERLAFGLFDVPSGYAEPELVSDHEMFIYVIRGELQARVGNEKRAVGATEVVQIPRGTPYQLDTKSSFVRYAMVCSTPWLEAKIDNMSPHEREQSRIHNSAN